MSMLIVEDGTGLNPSANSYATRAEIDAYHAEMGNTAWVARPTSPASPQPEEPLGDAAIIRATRAIDRLFGTKFKGLRTQFRIQPLEWPRMGVEFYADGSGVEIDEESIDINANENLFPDNEIPVMLKHAVAEAALRELASAGAMTPDLDRGGEIKKVQAGPVSVEYKDSAPATTKITSIDGLLKPLLKSTGSVDLVMS